MQPIQSNPSAVVPASTIISRRSMSGIAACSASKHCSKNASGPESSPNGWNNLKVASGANKSSITAFTAVGSKSASALL